jgi:hypothetical protein
MQWMLSDEDDREDTPKGSLLQLVGYVLIGISIVLSLVAIGQLAGWQ